MGGGAGAGSIGAGNICAYEGETLVHSYRRSYKLHKPFVAHL